MADYPGLAPDVLSYAQLEGAWDQAGGDPALASTMAAIAEAESSGDASAYNPVDNHGTQTSWGLWQISNGTHGEVSKNWMKPAVNAQLAVAKYHSQGLGAWGTYDSGAYQKHLRSGVKPSAAVPGGPAPAAAGSSSGSGVVWYEPWTWGNALTGTLTRYAAEGVAVLAGAALILWGAARATGAGGGPTIVERIQHDAGPALAAAAA